MLHRTLSHGDIQQVHGQMSSTYEAKDMNTLDIFLSDRRLKLLTLLQRKISI